MSAKRRSVHGIKNMTLAIISGILILGMLTGCSGGSAGEKNSGKTGQEIPDEEWVKEILNDASIKSNYPYWRLIDIDQDGASEMILSTTEKAFITDMDKACLIANVAGEGVILLEIGESAGDTFYYSPEEKALTWYYRSSGEKHIEAYQLKDGELEEIGTADFYEQHHYPEGDNAETVYLLNGKEVSEEECTEFWNKYVSEDGAVTYEALPK